MNILYTYSNCSPHKYEHLIESSGIMILQQAQKYHQLLLEGIIENGVNVFAYSCLPVNRQLAKKVIFKKEKDRYDKINYTYLPFINLPVMRNLCIFISSFFETFAFCLKNKDTKLICDILNISVSSGALFAARLLGKEVVGIVTDVPGIYAGNINGKVPITQRINQLILDKFSSYVFLTKQMNDVVNKKGKPYIVIEGHVNKKMENSHNDIEEKSDKKICIYAGSLRKIYGIKMLTEAFENVDVENAELHIYGDGDFADELKDICGKNNKIKYLGIKPNDYIVKQQLKATLLINPRPTNDEYTKYSFPSKNMEYMVSGTPTLTTRLPGMPEEYNDIVYLIDDETVDGLTKTLQEILSKTKEELHEKGTRAKEYVLREKNNVVQAKKILRIAEEMDTYGKE